MTTLSFKFVAPRYILAVTLITCAGLVADLSGLFVVVPVAIVSSKFLIYDGIIAVIKAKFPFFKVNPWLVVAYGVAVAGDMIFTYHASLNVVDAGFAFFGTFTVTPWILGLGLVIMAIDTYWRRGKK